MNPRCLKCGKAHTTKDCEIKERQHNTYCINCEVYGHTTYYTKCPRFSKPKKGTPISNRNNKNFTSIHVVEGISFASMLAGKIESNDPSPHPPDNKNNSERQSTSQNSSSHEDYSIYFSIPSQANFSQNPISSQTNWNISSSRRFSATGHRLQPAEVTPPQPPKPRTQHKAHSVPDMEWTSLTRFQSPEKCKRSIPVPRPKYNTAFEGFTQVDNQRARNNIERNAQICHSRRME
ncbi:uncharacterized protein TNCV_4682551 [Trichonephila clavipes]|nr:uncharacterized protein TNCV_4682551 [Trichonephila clavipes]